MEKEMGVVYNLRAEPTGGLSRQKAIKLILSFKLILV